MNRCSMILPFFLVFALLFSGCAPSVRNVDSDGAVIICFGDSITYGQGAREGEAYPALLRTMVPGEVINAGISGETTREALRRVKKDVLDEDPYLVIVEFGANDRFTGIPEDETAANLRKIIKMIQDEGAMTAICDISAGSSIIGGLDVYHKKMKRLSKNTGSIFIPRLMEGILQDPSMKSDHMHPNAAGYRLIAERVYESIKPYLRGRGANGS